MEAIASYNEGRAIGYSINGKFVMSFPARLNGHRIPDLDEAADILRGVSVEESDGYRFAARDLGTLARSIVADTVAALPGASAGCALTVTGDGTTRGVTYVMWHGRRSHTLHAVATSPARLMAHWSGFVENCRDDEQRRALDAEQARAAAAQCLIDSTDRATVKAAEPEAVRLSFVSRGKWELHNAGFPSRVFAVRVSRRPFAVWELRDEAGALAFGDGFEGLHNVRAYFG
jgi:hypothetical protein